MAAGDRERLIEEIRQYLADRPQAKDSFDGILWWLTKQRYERLRPLIQTVLDELVESGVLERRTRHGGETIYSLKQPEE